MELYQLRGLVAIATAGQLTRAAEKLHISQPALSAQLKALEEELDLTLFERSPNGMVPTAAGRKVLLDAERVLAAAQALLRDAKVLKGAVSGKARIGTLSDPEFIRLGQFMSDALARFPLLELELQQEVTGAALESVAAGELDASFYYGELQHADVAGFALREAVYRIVGPADWSARLKMADWREIADLQWIIPPAISTHHKLAHALLSKHGAEPAKVIEADQEAVVSSLVVSGVGVALMREDLALEKVAAGEVCVWKDIRLTTTLWFIYLRSREDDPVIRALLSVLAALWGAKAPA
jgi:DNA-binding transcriptional LysR family regulator